VNWVQSVSKSKPERKALVRVSLRGINNIHMPQNLISLTNSIAESNLQGIMNLFSEEIPHLDATTLVSSFKKGVVSIT